MTKKKKIRLEFPIKASQGLVYNYLSSPSGLAQWFCEDVDIYNDFYEFKWGKDEQVAQVLKKSANKGIRFQWRDGEDDEFFEFEIMQDELTDDVALVITEFVDPLDEKNTFQLWDSQIHELKMSIGA